MPPNWGTEFKEVCAMLDEPANADPEVIAIRTSDLHMDLDKIEKEILFEESMKPCVYMTCGFIIISIIILLSTILNI